MRNPFIALCELATRENWCWKIFCTTCGHMYFRYSFKELIKGKHPDQNTWAICKKNHHNLSSLLGPLPRSFNIDNQISLQGIAREVVLDDLRKTAKFPDWLGYIGLLLFYTEEAEGKNRVITKALVPQFLKTIRPNTPAYELLEEIMKNKSTLTWQDLEKIEISYLWE